MATSRRGGNYARYRKPLDAPRTASGQPAAHPTASSSKQRTLRETAAGYPDWANTRSPGNDESAGGDDDDDDIFDEELRNPSDALQILSRSTDRQRSSVELESHLGTANSTLGAAGLQIQNDIPAPDQTDERSPQGMALPGIDEYDLVAKGYLTPAEVCEMVQM